MALSRAERHAAVSAALSELTDAQLADLVAAGTPLGTGIGGVTVRLDVVGIPVFVKQVPLTAQESGRSTANVFGLPTFYQYCMGSAGFGAWRELVAHELTTSWVLDGALDCFPLLYHWRSLPRTPAAAVGVDTDVAYWDGSLAVRDRLAALAAAEHGLALFCEYVPLTAAEWLTAAFRDGDGPAAAAMVERLLLRDVPAMNALGLQHFDLHLYNVLTDGDRLHFADLGLASVPSFDLSPDERAFLAAHHSFDLAYSLASLVNWLVTHVGGVSDPLQRRAFVSRVAADGDTGGLPSEVADLVRRHAPVTVVVNDFIASLHVGSKTTPWPEVEIDRALT